MADEAGWETVGGTGKKNGAGKNKKKKEGKVVGSNDSLKQTAASTNFKKNLPKKKDISAVFDEQNDSGYEDSSSKSKGGKNKSKAPEKETVSLKTASSRLKPEIVKEYIESMKKQYPRGSAKVSISCC